MRFATGARDVLPTDEQVREQREVEDVALGARAEAGAAGAWAAMASAAAGSSRLRALGAVFALCALLLFPGAGSSSTHPATASHASRICSRGGRVWISSMVRASAR